MNPPDFQLSADSSPPPPGRALVERRSSAPLTAAPPAFTGFEDEPEGQGVDLRELLQVVIKRRWTIIIFTVIVVAAVVTATNQETPIYRANLTLQIDRDDIKVLAMESPGERFFNGKEYLETQYQLLQSRNLAKRVVDQMGLADRTAAKPAAPSLVSEAKGWLVGLLPGGGGAAPKQPNNQGQATDPAADSARMEGAIGLVLGGLSVAPIEKSRLVRLSYDGPNPQLAADILNNMAKIFINLNLERRFESTTYARNFLQERLQQLKTRLEESERELVDFSRREQIISVDQKESIITGNLAAASAALTDARRKRMTAESIYRQMEDGARGQGLTQVLDSKVIQDLKQSKSKLEAQYQENLGTYKRAFPTMVQLRAQITQIDLMINREIDNIRAATTSEITSNYQAARAEEAMLQTYLDRMTQEVLSLQTRSIPYNILRREADTNRQLYDGLLQRYKEVGVTAGIGTNNISVVDEAKVPRAPYKPNLRKSAMTALLLGLLGGIGLAFLFEHLDDSFRRPEELEKLLDIPMLGVIPKTPPTFGDDRAMALIGHDDQRSIFAEAYRSVRTALQFSTARGAPRLLTVTSAMPGEGKSTTALSLAIQFAQAGKRTLLIEADLRKPSVHRSLKLDNQTGLSNYLTGGEARPLDITRPTHIPNLFAITSGHLPPNPAELLSSARMLDLLSLAAEKFDQVILDSPPLLGLADALIIGNLCEGTLLTVEMGSTPRSYVQGTVKRLRSARVPLLGSILTKQEAQSGGYGYYRSYYYYQHTGYGEPIADQAKKLAG
ncbi:polysaccharide biosynthesis tyrosine autokinase [uncultured Thiodictyon sp.]|uniref:GumC family protein n=1 Tax=uncultured Thiodictyon sp. TaxID=1846217 RepID=UPI0025FD708B|nr:polysaccharide biosynthesis tyrosine autokinase [uncultured Thiodictyon sp.]